NGGDKSHLTVLDFIGNYRKVHYKLPFLAGLEDDSPAAQRRALQLLASGQVNEALPPGVRIELEPVSLDALRISLQQAGTLQDQLSQAFSALTEMIGRRPTLLEVDRRGRFSAAQYRRTFGSWYLA